MELVTYPHPALLSKTEPVETVDDEVRERVAEMFRIMRENNGVGLAAPQVGWSVRLFVVSPTAEPQDDAVFINPVIRRKRGRAAGEEGCLSFPGIFVQVERAKEIEVEYLDQDGRKHVETRTDFAARVIQHEYDHLENILLLHRMSPADRVRVKRDLQMLAERGSPE